MAKQSPAAKAPQSDPTMDAIYDPKTYEGFAVTGDWRQGFSVVINGIPVKFDRSLGVDDQIDFVVTAEVMDGETPTNVLLIKTSYHERASKLMQEFSRRSFDAGIGRIEENRMKAISAVMWAAGNNKEGGQ